MLACLYTPEEIHKRILELGAVITAHYQAEKLIVITVMNGGMIFGADLVRCIDLPLKMDSISVHSYLHESSTGELHFRGRPKLDVRTSHILIVDDILDTGFTMSKLKAFFVEQGALSVRVCCLINKDIPEESKLCHADWYAFSSPNVFLLGYGLDSEELYRNLPGIYQMKES